MLIPCLRNRARSCAACTGWPVAPSQQPWCSTCPAGWASTSTDAASCQMCMPGSFAAAPQSPACTACGNGTYAYSWGSTHCNHCIIGTYAPKQACLLGAITARDCLTCIVHVCASHTFAVAICMQERDLHERAARHLPVPELARATRCAADDMPHGWAQGSRLCMMCLSNTTNLEDGSASCPQAVLPGTNMTTRYAVIVSFGVYLNGTSLSDIAQKVPPCHCTGFADVSRRRSPLASPASAGKALPHAQLQCGIPVRAAEPLRARWLCGYTGVVGNLEC